MAFRFLHTADWQLGMRAQHVGAAAPAVREARWRAAERVVALANAARVDALVLAGDTFEDTNVPRDLVQRAVDLLRRSDAPVFVLPANHDPLVPHGLYDAPAWRDAAGKVTVLRELGPVDLGAAELLACPLRTKKSAEDPLAALPDAPAARARIRVGVAHGSLLGAGAPDADLADDFPLDRAHVTRAGLDYLALGHWHCPSTHAVDGVLRVAYPGAPEPTGFGEEADGGRLRSGGCLVVTLEAPGAPPVLEAHRTAELEWRRERAALHGAEDVARLRARLDAEGPAACERVLLELVLEGALGVEEARGLEDLETLARARYLHVKVRREGLGLKPGDDGWVARLPAGAAAGAARTLLERAGSTGPDAAVARRALELLHELAGLGGTAEGGR